MNPDNLALVALMVLFLSVVAATFWIGWWVGRGEQSSCPCPCHNRVRTPREK